MSKKLQANSVSSISKSDNHSNTMGGIIFGETNISVSLLHHPLLSSGENHFLAAAAEVDLNLVVLVLLAFWDLI